ncbi:153_t:CDS:2 [Paraglomus occultum]|uniref:153_t:CDS:1 n=1 Tax=Paraglomus occultum TaxID=144539 RepID=A0A9N9C387_9GLOM|nr:153_t:CDS:2 [Paraglomus occultum]
MTSAAVRPGMQVYTRVILTENIGNAWYFTVVTSNNELATTYESIPLSVNMNNEDDVLKKQLRHLFAVIKGLVQEKLDSLGDDSEQRNARIERLFKHKKHRTDEKD